MRCGAMYFANGSCFNRRLGCEGHRDEWIPLPFGGAAPPLGAHDATEVIQSGPDAGKTVGQLHSEVFDPNVSDQEYFESRRKAHGL